MLRQHASCNQQRIAELLELGVEIGSPAEAGGCDLHQRVLHIVVRGTFAEQACERGLAGCLGSRGADVRRVEEW
jgi:hypothetical protein